MHLTILHESVYRSSTIAVQTQVESLGQVVFIPESRGNKGCLGPLKRGYILNAESGNKIPVSAYKLIEPGITKLAERVTA